MLYQAYQNQSDMISPLRLLAQAFAPSTSLPVAVADYANAIHPYRDGHSSERVIAATDDLIAGRLGKRAGKPLSGRLRALQIRARLGYWKIG